MQLYYSGASNANSPQNLSEKSLGGFISSTRIPNDLVSNIFSVVSKSNLSKRQREFRIIFLKNTTGKDITDLQFFIKENGDMFSYSFAFLKVVNDSVDFYQNKNELPYYDFTKLENDEKLSVVEKLEKDSSIGIVILREFNQSFKTQSCLQLHEDFIKKNVSLTQFINSEVFEQSKPIFDKIKLCFEYESSDE